MRTTAFSILTAYKDTHPDHLAVMGILFGMTPPAVENCRVLEIGCSGGGNLIPMAAALPQSQFVGIDLATVPVETARRVYLIAPDYRKSHP